MVFVDSHCHLNMSRFGELFAAKVSSEEEYNEKYSTDAVISRADAADVKYLLTIGETLSTGEATATIIEKYSRVFRTVGIHPLEVEKVFAENSAAEIMRILREQCQHPKTVGIGEIGLDYSQGKASDSLQKRLFHMQMELAEEFGLPVSIHSRDAQVNTVEILRAYPNVRGVIHCFSGEEYFADAVLELGYYIGIGGIVTYKKADELRETLKNIPLNRILTETDAPFLAPVPMRGKINESSYIPYIAQKIADVRGESLDEVTGAVLRNFCGLFGINE